MTDEERALLMAVARTLAKNEPILNSVIQRHIDAYERAQKEEEIFNRKMTRIMAVFFGLLLSIPLVVLLIYFLGHP